MGFRMKIKIDNSSSAESVRAKKSYQSLQTVSEHDYVDSLAINI